MPLQAINRCLMASQYVVGFRLESYFLTRFDPLGEFPVTVARLPSAPSQSFAFPRVCYQCRLQSETSRTVISTTSSEYTSRSNISGTVSAYAVTLTVRQNHGL